MNVQTDIKAGAMTNRAGAIVQNAAQAATTAAGQVTDFMTNAAQQADTFASNVVNTTAATVNCLTSAFQ